MPLTKVRNSRQSNYSSRQLILAVATSIFSPIFGARWVLPCCSQAATRRGCRSHIYLIRQSEFGEIAQRLGSIPPTGLLMVLTPFMPTTRMEVGDSAEANLSDSTLQLQTSDSSRQLSLWQNEPVAAEIAKTPDTSSPEYDNGGKIRQARPPRRTNRSSNFLALYFPRWVPRRESQS